MFWNLKSKWLCYVCCKFIVWRKNRIDLISFHRLDTETLGSLELIFFDNRHPYFIHWKVILVLTSLFGDIKSPFSEFSELYFKKKKERRYFEMEFKWSKSIGHQHYITEIAAGQPIYLFHGKQFYTQTHYLPYCDSNKNVLLLCMLFLFWTWKIIAIIYFILRKC